MLTARNPFQPNAPSSDLRAQTQDWLQVFPPKSVSELAVHPAKTKAVKGWVQDAVREHFAAERMHHFKPRLLVLCGCSGCGKSTMVELVCREMGIEVLEWSDDMLEIETRAPPGVWRPSSGRPLPHTVAGEMEDWSCQAAFPSLDLVGGSAPVSSRGPASRSTGGDAPAGAKVILMHSPPFQNMKRADLESCGELFLSFSVPVIVILSEVGGSDDMSFAADRALGLKPAQKNCLNYQVMYCNPITALKTAKALQSIVAAAQKEYMTQRGSRRRDPVGADAVPSAPYKPSDDEIEDIAQSSLGDLRHAVIQLQLLCIYKANGSGRKGLPNSKINPFRNDSFSAASEHRHRDVSFSSLHGVGKLLRAQQNADGRFDSDLNFIMERSEFPLDMSLAFMQYHCIESLHRTSQVVGGADSAMAECALLEDIGSALDCFAEAGMFWDKQFSVNSNLMEQGGSSSGGIDNYPVSYAVSIASRATGVARGMKSRLWTESSISQGWEYLPPSTGKDQIIDLSGNGEEDTTLLYEDFDLESALRTKPSLRQHKHKKARIASDGNAQPSSKGGGFLKLTRPKVLDLWRSNKWTSEQALHFRNDLICRRDEAKKIFNQTSYGQPPVLRSWIGLRELYITLVPLLRIILDRKSSNDHRNVFNSIAVPGGVSQFISHQLYRRLSSLFTLKTSLDHEQSLYGLEEYADDMMAENRNLSEPAGDAKPGDMESFAAEDEVLIMDDIEEF